MFVALLATTMSCQKNTSSTEEQQTEVSAAEHSLNLTPENTELTWTAYKTTEKVPVSGTFQKLNFEARSGERIEDILNNLNFSIPISSLFTNDASGTRDPKIIESFFGKMIDTDVLTGKIILDGEQYKAEIKMNGQTNVIPLDYKISDTNEVTMTGTMQLKDWNALEALAFLNEACFDLHKGSDGVSKTWEDVALEVKAQL